VIQGGFVTNSVNTPLPTGAIESETRDAAHRLAAWWTFDEGEGDTAADASGNGHQLTAVNGPQWTGSSRFGAVSLDGAAQHLATQDPAVRTDESYSVAAWVRLDSSRTDLRLPAGWHAVTAVSQSGPSRSAATHCQFYLGARTSADAQPDGTTKDVLRWCFTVAPADGSVEQKLVDWQHAMSGPIESSALDRWELLVGVYDVATRKTHLFVPGRGEVATVELPEQWTLWHAGGQVHVGQAIWLGNMVDQWPGSVGPVRLYAGVLTESDAARLYADEAPTS
jgi:hypothetical protein